MKFEQVAAFRQAVFEGFLWGVGECATYLPASECEVIQRHILIERHNFSGRMSPGNETPSHLPPLVSACKWASFKVWLLEECPETGHV